MGFRPRSNMLQSPMVNVAWHGGESEALIKVYQYLLLIIIDGFAAIRRESFAGDRGTAGPDRVSGGMSRRTNQSQSAYAARQASARVFLMIARCNSRRKPPGRQDGVGHARLRHRRRGGPACSPSFSRPTSLVTSDAVRTSGPPPISARLTFFSFLGPQPKRSSLSVGI